MFFTTKAEYGVRLLIELGSQPAGRSADSGTGVQEPGSGVQGKPVGEPAQSLLAAAPATSRGHRVLGAERPHGLLGPGGHRAELGLHRLALELGHAASLSSSIPAEGV